MQSQQVRGGERLLRARQIYQRLGISERTFYNRLKSGEFPAGVLISPRHRAWPESVVDAWIATVIANATE